MSFLLFIKNLPPGELGEVTFHLILTYLPNMLCHSMNHMTHESSACFLYLEWERARNSESLDWTLKQFRSIVTAQPILRWNECFLTKGCQSECNTHVSLFKTCHDRKFILWLRFSFYTLNIYFYMFIYCICVHYKWYILYIIL